MSKREILNRLGEILDSAGLGDNEKINVLLGRPEKKKSNTLAWIIGLILAAVAVAGIVYAIMTYFKPEYLEDLNDDFEDDFEDDFFEDEEDEDDVFESEE